MLGRICGAVAALSLLSAPALSQAMLSQVIEHAYTKFDSKTCKHTKGKDVEDYGSWLCEGYAGLRVRLSGADQRMTVTFGPTTRTDLAPSQTLPAFNDVYEGTVEWRIEKPANGKPRPFATILRWNIVTAEDQEKATGPIRSTGRVLVVTRLGPGGVCHVGYVDARANADANELARKLADEHARTFKCGKDKRMVMGKKGSVGMPSDED
jgi:hypothetical protein